MKKETNFETNVVSKQSRGERIKAERKRLNLTQQQVADACDVHRVQWGRYERGEQGLDGEPLKKFGTLGASISYILTGEHSNVTSVGQVKPVDKVSSFSSAEEELLNLFRMMNVNQRKILMETARQFVGEF
ncbi:MULTISPECIES: helix-turn-helix domain-containing protein [unclassified Acinetobacter]|uniref:helix-turn-helix domain-containing protein n=1 Tax=unclassified Acinetobacter TaxID=196816 RepID=UPI0035BA2D20